MRGAISAKTQFFSPEVACDKASCHDFTKLLGPSYFVVYCGRGENHTHFSTLYASIPDAYLMPLSVCGAMPIDWLTAS